MKGFERILTICIFVCPLLIFTGSFLSVGLFAHAHDGSKADCIIVLGAAVWNSHPSPVYRERLNFAAELFHRRFARSVITTGGVGDGDTLSEGQVGKNYLLSRGVPEQSISFESTSRTTLQNLANAKPALATNDCQSNLIVSDPLHLRRAMAMAKGLGIDAKPASTPTSMYQSWGTKLELLWSEAYYLLQYWVAGV